MMSKVALFKLMEMMCDLKSFGFGSFVPCFFMFIVYSRRQIFQFVIGGVQFKIQDGVVKIQ